MSQKNEQRSRFLETDSGTHASYKCMNCWRPGSSADFASPGGNGGVTNGKSHREPAKTRPAHFLLLRSVSKHTAKSGTWSWDVPRFRTFRREQPFGWPDDRSAGRSWHGAIRIGRWKESAFEVPIQAG